MKVTGTMMGSIKSTCISLLLLTFLLIMADSYANTDFSSDGCEECSLKRTRFSMKDRPIFQCSGCCFSRAYPTPFASTMNMDTRKNITSEATCCVAKNFNEVQMGITGARLRNHTECHCSTCHYHKI
ncbi:glycoprotein hormones alpha chain [Synchiropus picturatus]